MHVFASVPWLSGDVAGGGVGWGGMGWSGVGWGGVWRSGSANPIQQKPQALWMLFIEERHSAYVSYVTELFGRVDKRTAPSTEIGEHRGGRGTTRARGERSRGPQLEKLCVNFR